MTKLYVFCTVLFVVGALFIFYSLANIAQKQYEDTAFFLGLFMCFIAAAMFSFAKPLMEYRQIKNE